MQIQANHFIQNVNILLQFASIFQIMTNAISNQNIMQQMKSCNVTATTSTVRYISLFIPLAVACLSSRFVLAVVPCGIFIL